MMKKIKLIQISLAEFGLDIIIKNKVDLLHQFSFLNQLSDWNAFWFKNLNLLHSHTKLLSLHSNSHTRAMF